MRVGGESGLIFDVKRYAIHDGPGIRTTVFLKGCPLECIWCDNPESQRFEPEVAFFAGECVSCGHCVTACPSGAVAFRKGRRSLDRSRCRGCGECARACPRGAVRLMGRRVEPEELFKEIVVDRPFWDRSGGGVTLSGGEPLAQPEFSRALLEVCRRARVHTAIETSGYAPAEHLRHVAAGADLVIYDLKAIDDELHHRLTGRRNQLVKDNLLVLLETGVEVLVRVPLVPGCNDSRTDLEALGAFLEAARPGIRVEPLAYHRLGEAKYPRLGREYALEGMATPGEGFLAEAQRVLETYRVTVVTDQRHRDGGDHSG